VRLAAVLAALTAALAACTPAPTPAPPAPAQAEAALRLPDMPLHDPFIVADPSTRTYHLFTSNEARMTGVEGVGVMAYTSRDLKHWTRPKLVFRMPPGIWANAGGWAPEVHSWNGRWRLFVTLHNEAAPLPGEPGLYRRGTILAASDRLEGPFEVVRQGEPIVPADRMTLDATLYVDRNGRPWTVFANEWIQRIDGTIEAMPLDDQLRAAGAPKVLFRASDAPWAAGQAQSAGPRQGRTVFVTDGPQLHRTRTGELIMLWSSWGRDGYVQSQARSASGEIDGPWIQLEPLVGRDSGHGMLFRTFDGRLMMVLHRPFRNARGKLYEMRDAEDRFEIVRQRTDLDGDPPQP
jgi:beta-xylosidase